MVGELKLLLNTIEFGTPHSLHILTLNKLDEFPINLQPYGVLTFCTIGQHHVELIALCLINYGIESNLPII